MEYQAVRAVGQVQGDDDRDPGSQVSGYNFPHVRLLAQPPQHYVAVPVVYSKPKIGLINLGVSPDG